MTTPKNRLSWMCSMTCGRVAAVRRAAPRDPHLWLRRRLPPVRNGRPLTIRRDRASVELGHLVTDTDLGADALKDRQMVEEVPEARHAAAFEEVDVERRRVDAQAGA